MKVLLNKDNVVIAKGNIEDLGNNEFKANGAIFGAYLELTLEDHPTLTDADVMPQRDKLVNGAVIPNNSFDNWFNKKQEQAKELGREEIRQHVREADALGNINDNARAKLIEKGILEG